MSKIIYKVDVFDHPPTADDLNSNGEEGWIVCHIERLRLVPIDDIRDAIQWNCLFYKEDESGD